MPSHLDQLILVKALVQWYLLVYLVQLGLHIFSTAPHLLQHLAFAHMLRTLAYDAGMCQCVRQLVILDAVLDQRSHAVWESATVMKYATFFKTVVKTYKILVQVCTPSTAPLLEGTPHPSIIDTYMNPKYNPHNV